ncbi:MAG: hypothetical protein B6I18_06885 [Bacteroidetes bacterium 4572_112]|nr:MAG: hypothetical protein B6I18_06885 [Bacteroidetes bacterium 4572_112]
MGTVNSVLNSVYADIEAALNNSVPELSSLLEIALRRAIWDNIYAKPEGESYDRSFGLINSVISEHIYIGKTIEISSFSNPDEMDWIPGEEHSSWSRKTDERENIAYWMSRGHGGLAYYEETNYEKEAMESVFNQKKYKKIINKNLKLRGYKSK